ncbi:hypothetical protein MAR_037733, partial [Mya arenaria]
SAIRIEVEISFNWTSSDLNFNLSSTYEEYKTEAERMLEHYYEERLNAEVDIYIKNIWSSPIHVLFVVTYSTEDPAIARALSDGTKELHGAELTFFGVNIHPETVSLPELCDVNCNHCVLKDGLAICRAGRKAQKMDKDTGFDKNVTVPSPGHSSDERYLTWRTMLSSTDTYDEIRHIPRPKQTLAANNVYT